MAKQINALELEIDDILQDADSDLQLQQPSTSAAVQIDSESKCTGIYCNQVQVNAVIVNQACEELIADAVMPPEVHQVCSNVDRQALVPLMQFLDMCLVRKSIFKSDAKEKSWTNFRKAMEEASDIKKLDDLVTSNVSPWLCFQTFEILIAKQFMTQSQDIDQISTITEREKTIICYVGGSVLQKIKQRTHRIKDGQQKQSVLDCVAQFCVTESSPDSMTGLLDRGGLIKLHPNAQQLFHGLEIIFRKQFSGFQHTLSFDAYFKHCTDSDEVSTRFFDHLYQVEADIKTKEKFFREVVLLYFKIRAHHKCRVYMDDINRHTHKTRREKGLRKRLKTQQ